MAINPSAIYHATVCEERSCGVWENWQFDFLASTNPNVKIWVICRFAHCYGREISHIVRRWVFFQNFSALELWSTSSQFWSVLVLASKSAPPPSSTPPAPMAPRPFTPSAPSFSEPTPFAAAAPAPVAGFGGKLAPPAAFQPEIWCLGWLICG